MLLLVVFLLAIPTYTQSAGQKNVLFFAVDDLRAELGAYNQPHVKSPNIDQLADRSMVFDRAYCQVALCSPSRTSLLTGEVLIPQSIFPGRRPDTLHVWKNTGDEYWRALTNATTIPQYFKENGYISIGMGKVFQPGGTSGKDDYMYSWSPEGLPYYHSPLGSKYGPVNITSSWWSFEGFKDNQLPDGQIADNAVSVLKELGQNRSKGDSRPFFLAVGFHKPHLPLFAPDRYFDMYPPINETKIAMNKDAPDGMPDIAWSVWFYFRKFKDMKFDNSCVSDAEASIHSQKCHMPDEKAQELRRAYYSCISYTDAQIGKVIEELKAQRFDDSTIIVLWGDHGWQLGEHNEWEKYTNFEDAVHVPFILHVPGITDKGMRSNALVELIDIFPSLTELAGLKVPSVCPEDNNSLLTCVEGTSVVPLLENPSTQWKKAAFSQYARPLSGLHQIPNKPKFSLEKVGHSEDVMGYTMRVDQYRFTEWYSFNRTSATPYFDKIWGTELYDHTNSTVLFNDENENLANKPEMQSLVEELRKQLHAGWRSATP